jgi:hypothetical protein
VFAQAKGEQRKKGKGKKGKKPVKVSVGKDVNGKMEMGSKRGEEETNGLDGGKK